MKWLITIALSAFLALPATVLADRDKGQGHSKHDNDCYKYKGRIICREEEGKGKGKEKGKAMRESARGQQAAGGPPPWAPAHGWRRKNEMEKPVSHQRETETVYVTEKTTGAQIVAGPEGATVDVGIQKGTCNRKVVGTVVGGIIGGVIGNNVADGEERATARILGAVIGGIVGNNIGRSMDERDQTCVGQALEQAADRQTVSWMDKTSNGEYRVTPERTYQTDGRYCRDYLTEYKDKTGITRDKSTACRTADGSWQKLVM